MAVFNLVMLLTLLFHAQAIFVFICLSHWVDVDRRARISEPVKLTLLCGLNELGHAQCDRAGARVFVVHVLCYIIHRNWILRTTQI